MEKRFKKTEQQTHNNYNNEKTKKLGDLENKQYELFTQKHVNIYEKKENP